MINPFFSHINTNLPLSQVDWYPTLHLFPTLNPSILVLYWKSLWFYGSYSNCLSGHSWLLWSKIPHWYQIIGSRSYWKCTFMFSLSLFCFFEKGDFPFSNLSFLPLSKGFEKSTFTWIYKNLPHPMLFSGTLTPISSTFTRIRKNFPQYTT